MSQHTPVSDRMIVTVEPPTGARIGCALVVSVLLVHLVTLLLFWYALYTAADFAEVYSNNKGNWDLVVAYMQGAHPELFHTPWTEIFIGLGLLAGVVLVSYFEARKFLIWLKVRG